MNFNKLFFGVLVLFASMVVAADQVSGKVVSVYDGDTITVLSEQNKQIKVRLAEIDAPEKAQPFGEKSKQALSYLVFGKTVKVDIHNVDRYKRNVSTVYLDGRNVNREMVLNGYAYVYRQYSKDPSFIAAESKAKSNKAGLWSMPESERVMPSEWRRSGNK